MSTQLWKKWGHVIAPTIALISGFGMFFCTAETKTFEVLFVISCWLDNLRYE